MNTQNKISKKVSNLAKNVAESSLIFDGYGTTCMILHQPKAPASLKKFSKFNDK